MTLRKFITLVFLIHSFIACLPGQLSQSYTDGGTPSAMAPGSPAGSYQLTGLDTVNLFNGHLNFVVPVYRVGGRGEVGYQLSVPIERNWTVLYSYDAVPNVQSWLAQTALSARSHWWSDLGAAPRYSPGNVQIRRSGAGATVSCPYGDRFDSTRVVITYTNETGTEAELVDSSSGGAIKSATCPGGKPAGYNRGRIFETRDGSGVTFISDDEVVDRAYADNLNTEPATGWLHFKDGSRYRVEDRQIRRMYDRNGNRVSISYESLVGGVNSITDAAGRTLSVTGTSNDLELSYPGDGNVTRKAIVRFSSLSSRLGREELTGDVCTIKSYYELFGTSGGSSLAFNPQVISEIEIPNGKKYQFRYNSYGELVQAILPTGGQYRYAHGPGVGNSSEVRSGTSYARIYRRVLKKWVYLGGGDGPSLGGATLVGSTTFNAEYSDVAPVSNYGLHSNTTVTQETFDSAGLRVSKEVHYFSGGVDKDDNIGTIQASINNWHQGLEYKTEIYGVDGVTPYRTIEREYQQRPCDTGEYCLSAKPAGSSTAESYPYYGNDLRLVREDTMVSDGVPGYNYKLARKTFAYDRHNNTTEVQEFDYGRPPNAGALLRKSTTDYKTDISYTQIAMSGTNPDSLGTTHLRGLPIRKSVYSATNDLQSKQEFEYDGTALTNLSNPNEHPLTAISGEPIWTTADVRRGNVSKTRSYLVTESRFIESSLYYDVVGNLVKKVDPGNQTSLIDYSDRCTTPALLGTYAYPTKTTNAAGQVLETTFDCYLGKAKIISEKSVQGGLDSTTTYSYDDSLDRLKSVTFPVGMTTYSYDDTALTVTSSAKQNSCGLADQNLVTTQTYDGLGRVIREEGMDASGLFFTEKTFDVLGRVTKSCNPRRTGETCQATSLTYDGLGRTVKVIAPDGAQTTTQYEAVLATITDPANRVIRSLTDGLGRVVGVQEGFDGPITEYTYDPLDHLVKVSADTQQRSYRYDSLGRLICVSNPEARVSTWSCWAPSANSPLQTTGVLRYAYDDNSNLLTRTDARGVATNYTYDGLNRLKTVSDSLGEPKANVTYGYDTCRLGQLCSAANDFSSNTWSYDLMGRMIGSSQTTDSTTYNFSYSLDLAGRVEETTYPSNNKVKSCVDTAARPISLSRTKNGTTTNVVSALSSEANGAVSRMTLGNGVREVYCYNNRMQMSGWAVRPGMSNLCSQQSGDLLNVSLGYVDGGQANNSGNIRQSTTSLFVNPTTARNYVQTHTYDTINRLLKTSETNEAGNAWSIANGYDRYGNRWVDTAQTTVTLAQGTPVGADWFNTATNRLTKGSGNALVQFDDAGNLTSHPDLGTMTYDAENHMLSSTQGTQTVRYRYDANGRRVQQIRGTRVTTYVYDAGGALMAEYDTNPDVLAEGFQYHHLDHLGSARLGTNASGNVVYRKDYFPFGEEIAGSASLGKRNEIAGYGGAANHRLFFTGQERDDTGLDNFGARYYGGTLGRFLSADAPFADQNPGDPQSWNLFAYARNNPLRYVDPNGTCSQDADGNYFDDDSKGTNFVEPGPCPTSGPGAVSRQGSSVTVTAEQEVVQAVSMFFFGDPRSKNVEYGPDSAFTRDFMGSVGMKAIEAEIKNQCKASGSGSVGSWDAFVNTMIDGILGGAGFLTPQAQMGAFTTKYTRGGGRADITLTNRISANSLLYHALSPSYSIMPISAPELIPLIPLEMGFRFGAEVAKGYLRNLGPGGILGSGVLGTVTQTVKIATVDPCQ